MPLTKTQIVNNRITENVIVPKDLFSKLNLTIYRDGDRTMYFKFKLSSFKRQWLK